jgi:uncharacterized protein YndB with AHSA1/START domain
LHLILTPKVDTMTSALLYRGPAIDVLHEEYAKRGRIDDRAAVSTGRDIVIAAPVERVWALLSDPMQWATWHSGIHDVEVEAPTAVDVRFAWSNGRARMQSRFAVVAPGHEITWTGVAGGAKAIHRHVLDAPTPTTTRVHCEESMSGFLLGLFFGNRKLRATIETWLDGLRVAAEQPVATPA